MNKHLHVMIAALLVAGGCQQQTSDNQPATPNPAPLDKESKMPDDQFPGKKYRDAFAGLAAQYERKAQLEPDNAAVYADLSENYSTLWCFGFYARNDALPKAKAAAEKAVLLNEKFGFAHTAMGMVRLFDWDWIGAEREFVRAIQLNPKEPRSHHWYALYLSAMGRYDQAMEESTQAEKLDPSSLGFKTGKGAILYFGHKFEEMKKQMLATVAPAPDFPWGYDWLGMAYVQLGDFGQAIKTYQKAAELSDRTAEVLAGLGHAYGKAGRKSDGEKVLEELDRYAAQWYVPPVQMAYVCFGLGEETRAFELLEKAFQLRAWELVFIQVEPWFDSYRSDPRFINLQQRMNFPK